MMKGIRTYRNKHWMLGKQAATIVHCYLNEEVSVITDLEHVSTHSIRV
jgi:hypothetical protein